ncbi:MAG TPA: glycosyltransferase family 2 protein [Desulfobacteraceae bacterium]|nr:glycosyltransferase family 2 protein [Desulfobacteraceae bacterium]
MSTMNAAIIIPVYNHEQRIAGVIRQTLALGLPVFVVDDGSTDRTAEIIKAIEGITVLHHCVNQGKGAAILTGFAAAVKKKCDLAITIDGDGQHTPEDAGVLLSAAADGKRCLVVGRRRGMEGGGNVPWTSRFGRKFSNFWVRVSGGPAIEDSQSGFRLYPLPEAMQLGVRARRYQFEVEILVKARQHGIEIIEVPVQVVYQVKGERVSHFRPWVDFCRNSTTFSRLIFARIFRMFRP